MSRRDGPSQALRTAWVTNEGRAGHADVPNGAAGRGHGADGPIIPRPNAAGGPCAGSPNSAARRRANPGRTRGKKKFAKPSTFFSLLAFGARRLSRSAALAE